MKKIVALAAFFLALATLLPAQSDIRFGFQLSPTFTWMNTSASRINPSGSNLGLKLGMLGEFYFRENYAFISGIGFGFNHGGTLLHEVGGTYWTKTDLPADTLGNQNTGVKLKYGIQYVEIPIGLKLRTKEFGYLRYFMEPAITLGFKTQAQGRVIGESRIDSEEKFDIRREVNALNLSWGITGGLEYSLSESTSLVGGLGIQIGFADTTDDNGTAFDARRGWPGSNPREDSKGRVNAFILRLGVIF
jgi:hypothetical protein